MPGFFPQINDVLRSRTIMTVNGQVGMNVMHWKVRNILTGGANLLEIATALDQTWNAAYKGWLSSQVTYRGVGCTNLTPPATVEETELLFIGPGLGSAVLLPTQVSGLIKILSPFSGKAFRGRVYIPFADGANITGNGELNAAGKAALLFITNALGPTQTIVGVTGTTVLDLWIKHARSATNPPPSLLGSTADRLVGSDSWATQRRRGDYGRLNPAPF